jgi:uncharacterized protein
MDRIQFPFKEKRVLIGTVHLKPLPGTARFAGKVETVLASARADARAWLAGGADGLIVENFGDAPFTPGRVEPHTVALLTLAAQEIGRLGNKPVGVNVLRNDGRAALGVARAVGAAFIRVNVFTGVVATDQGIIEGEAQALLAYRNLIGAGPAILADVHVKHGRPLHSTSIAQDAEEAYLRGRADALIVTGSASGAVPDTADLEAVHNALPEAPLVAGSGLTPDNAPEIFRHARAAIVGTWCKEGGDISAPVDRSRVERLADAVRKL